MRLEEGVRSTLHHNNVGSPHFCFYVPDVKAKYAELQKRGDVKKIPTACRWNSFNARKTNKRITND